MKSSSTSDGNTTSESVDAQSNDVAANNNQGNDSFCYCHGPDVDSMIACDNSACKIEWLHQKLKNIPRGKWYCPDCHKLPQFCKGKKKQ